MAGIARRIAEAEAALVTLDEATARASNSVVERDGAILRLVIPSKPCGRPVSSCLLSAKASSSARLTARSGRRGGSGFSATTTRKPAMRIARDRNLAIQMYRGRIREEIQERLGDHATVLRRWLDALKAHDPGS